MKRTHDPSLTKHLTNEWPEYAASAGTHERVLELVKRHAGGEARRVLDLPCGAGSFSRRLHDLGFGVVPADIAPVEPFLGERRERVITDANQPLPFGCEFDAVVSIEGIEHLENPSLFLRECARVVKPGGHVFISTPNVDSLRSRRYALIHGFHRFFGPVNDTDKDSGHLHPIDMIFMHGAARRARLEIVETTVNRIEKKGWLTERLRPLLTRRLPGYMKGEVPFYGDCMIYVLRKAGGPYIPEAP